MKGGLARAAQCKIAPRTRLVLNARPDGTDEGHPQYLDSPCTLNPKPDLARCSR